MEEVAVHRVRGLTGVVLSTVLALALTAVLGTQPSAPPAAAATPSWQTTSTSPPMANVRAVSCAPSISPSSATCVAVGDDGGHVASIIVTNDGGGTWSDTVPPAGVGSLSTVSCPSSAVCYAGGGSGIIKSTDGGSSWRLEECLLPGRVDLVLHNRRVHRRWRDRRLRNHRRVKLEPADVAPCGADDSLERVVFKRPLRALCSGVVSGFVTGDCRHVRMGTTWATLGTPL